MNQRGVVSQLGFAIIGLIGFIAIAILLFGLGFFVASYPLALAGVVTIVFAFIMALLLKVPWKVSMVVFLIGVGLLLLQFASGWWEGLTLWGRWMG